MNLLKNRFRPCLIFCMAFLYFGVALAQESSNTSGGDATGSGGSVAYSIGQLVYTLNTGSSGSVAQGVQHAYEIFSVGLHETPSSITLKAFPNPITDNVTLILDNFSNENFFYSLTTSDGKEIRSERIVSNQTLVDMNGIPSASYFMHILDRNNNLIQSFKIVKN